jgi:hypothetical protein
MAIHEGLGVEWTLRNMISFSLEQIGGMFREIEFLFPAREDLWPLKTNTKSKISRKIICH